MSCHVLHTNAENIRKIPKVTIFKMATFESGALKNYGYLIGGTIVLHPFALVRTLIQVGIEPIKPTVHTSYFGRKSLAYPGLFPYMKHIVKVDGWTGLFRGVVPHATYALLVQFSTDLLRPPVDKAIGQIIERVAPRGADVPDNEEGARAFSYQVRRYFKKFCISAVLGMTSCTMFHPLKVIAVRAMVQFDGRETVYSNIIGAFQEIYNKEGIGGFFAGLVPLLIGRIGVSFLQNFFSMLLEQAMFYWVPEGIYESYRAFKQVFTTFVAGHLMYPYQLVSTMMIVNGSGLNASQFGVEPFDTWRSCYSYLSHCGIRYRGSNIIFSRKNVFPKNSELLQ